MTDVTTVAAGYRALRERCAWLELSHRGRIRVEGEDRARLLHAMTTNNVQDLAPGSGCYLFFLNAQGRILGDANLLVCEDSILLDTEGDSKDKLAAHLDKYIIADDATLHDETESTFCLSIEGPEAAAKIESMGFHAPDSDFASTLSDSLRIERVSSTGLPGFRFFGPLVARAALIERFVLAAVPEASAEAQRAVRIENGKPRYGEDITESSLPQETRQMHALHFQKGCYLGQEIVERIRSRGRVNRVLARLRIDTAEPPAPGSKVIADGKEVGAVSSSAWSPALGKSVALASVRVEALEGASPLSVNGSPLEAVPA